MQKVLATLIIFSLLATGLLAQETYFGKNKVRYRNFDWSYIQTRHFDIYFYGEAYPIAKFAADVLEKSYKEISDELNYNLQDRVPVFLYNSHNEMQQTNIIPNLLSEGIGGFTEPFKNRVALPFTGSYEDFRHVLHHELTHAMIHNMLFGNNLASLISRQRLFNLPNWFAEGYAEYSSRHGWDYNSDMFMRDATINNYLTPPQYLQYNYFAYRQGQAMVKYIVDKYGEDKLHKILLKGKVHLTMPKAIKAALGITQEEFWKDFSKEMKRRYWPSIATLKEASEIGKQLTKARKDGSYFNEKPVYSPDGDKIAMFTDKSDYTEIVLISPYDGKHLRRLVKSARSADLESLHAYVSGMSFSPDGKSMVFAAKSQGKESLFFLDVKKAKVYRKVRLHFQNILNPAWSPDGNMVAFSALDGSKRDLYVYHIDSEELDQITDDRYDDMQPSWMPGSDELVFSSDHPHPQNPEINHEGHPYLISADALMPGDFEYGTYNIFRVGLDKQRIEPINVGPGQNRQPRVSPEGDQIAFISNRNGIDNIYLGAIDSSHYYAVTDILTGVRHVSWAPSGDKLAFSAFNQGAFDIFILEDIVPVGEDGVLDETDFVKGTYNLLEHAMPDTYSQVVDTTDQSAEPADSTEVTDGADDAVDNSLAVGDITTTDSTADATVIATTVADPELASPETTEAADETARTEDEKGKEEKEDKEGKEESDELTATDSTTTTDDGDEFITETGIYDDEFVYVSSANEIALDSVLHDLKPASDSSSIGLRRKEPAAFDSIPGQLASGEYKISPYQARLSTDYVGGGFAYDTFFGVRGQTVFVFSDHLGNHQLYIATDLVNSLDQSYIQAFYLNNQRRTSLGVGIFHSKNFYEDQYPFFFSDRYYGVTGFASRPYSTFSRVEASMSQVFIDRKYLHQADPRPNRSSEVTTFTASYVFDNVLWGFTAPVNGRRIKLSLDGGKNFFDQDEISFYSASLDYRNYWHLGKTASMAVRFSGGASFGGTPKQYFLGGTTNWIGTRTLNARVYDVENLYFADIVTPLRGQDYYGLSGDRYALFNWELRFPMIQYFAMKYPLPLVLSNITGVIYTDIGAAWYGSSIKLGSSSGGNAHLENVKTGVGTGMRLNMFGFALLRIDVAWATDFHTIDPHPTTYFSFGADF